VFCPRCHGVASWREQGFVCGCGTCFFAKDWSVHADHLIEPDGDSSSLVLRRRTKPDLRKAMALVVCFVLLGLAWREVALVGFGSSASVLLIGAAATALFLLYFLHRDVFGRVLLRFEPEALSVSHRPALLNVPLAIPRVEILSVWVRADVNDESWEDTYEQVVERSSSEPESILHGVPDLGALVALAELVGSRAGVRSQTRARELSAEGVT
jgi:hypothetical protein